MRKEKGLGNPKVASTKSDASTGLPQPGGDSMGLMKPSNGLYGADGAEWWIYRVGRAEWWLYGADRSASMGPMQPSSTQRLLAALPPAAHSPPAVGKHSLSAFILIKST